MLDRRRINQLTNTRKSSSKKLFNLLEFIKESFRSEKLYVTKQTEAQRRISVFSYWFIALALISGAIVIAVLIGSNYPSL